MDYFGVFPSEQLSKLHVCLEYMDAGGLDSLLSLVGRLPEPIIVEIAASVLQALTYLWREHGLMHQ